MVQVCPISPDQVDERAGRCTAFLSLVAVALGASFGWGWLLLGLAADFGLRAAGRGRFSPLARLASALRALAGLDPRPVNAGPKRFAALVGLVFTVAVLSAHLLGTHLLALALAGILVGCAALEAFAGFCVACQLYPYLRLLRRGTA